MKLQLHKRLRNTAEAFQEIKGKRRRVWPGFLFLCPAELLAPRRMPTSSWTDEIIAWSRSRAIFGGVSVDGAVVMEDPGEKQRSY